MTGYGTIADLCVILNVFSRLIFSYVTVVVAIKLYDSTNDRPPVDRMAYLPMPDTRLADSFFTVHFVAK